ncbi:hypothetical protein ASG29_00410 [Sphingomonas sp. Leaf412]|uniref:hypothetical protein n=1 Tax=Sphingomonas sp. Leaf412 TaxID=1736370 RepID=UPI0006F8A700|nr:hypothetical protein [Sphingomonas sp. Leaf412]KQT34670.1 hypothetical protein ASG29_00410 [Sphingomonas sp. Leaf412]
MSAVERAAARAAEGAVARATGRVADVLRDVPGVTVSAEAGRVVVAGRGLVRRMLTDARLRWVAGWLR